MNTVAGSRGSISRADRPLLRGIAVAAVALLVLLVGTRSINTATVGRDSTQSLVMAENLAHHGVMSLNEKPPYIPSDYREPIPIVLSALGIKVMDAVLGRAPAPAYFSGARLKYLKYQNLLWLALMCTGVFWCIYVPTRSFYVGLAGALAGGLLFHDSILNDLTTDIAGAAGLALASAPFAGGLARDRAAQCIAAGLLFGALVLIKAAMLYVFVGMMGLLICIGVFWRSRIDTRAYLRNIGITILALIVVVCPWVARNWLELGTFQVAQRAGVVLMVRALKDLMTPEEYLGSFYVWSPHALQSPVGRILGFNARDLQRGGRLQHLNRSEDSDFAAADIAAEKAGRPEDAVSYYRRGRAQRVKLEQQLESAGSPNPDVAADTLLQQQAMALIKAHPVRHLALTIPFLWRGALIAFPVLLVAMGIAIRKRRYDCALVALPSFGLIMFYALLSHFIPRYGLPVRPVLIALILIGAKLAMDARRPQHS